MSAELLRELVRLDRDATPGPWTWVSDEVEDADGHARYLCNNGALSLALRNNLPQILRALAVQEAVEGPFASMSLVESAYSIKRIRERAAEILADWTNP